LLCSKDNLWHAAASVKSRNSDFVPIEDLNVSKKKQNHEKKWNRQTHERKMRASTFNY